MSLDYMIRLSHYNGNPYIGVYAAANEFVAFVPRDAPESLLNDIRDSLQVEVQRATLASTNLMGSLLSMNSYGAVVSNMASASEVEALSAFLPVFRIEDRINASGNNILANDYGCVANPDLSKPTLRGIEETLQVPVAQATVADHRTVGSVCAATNKGVICHPSTSRDEMAFIKDMLKVPVAIGTLNYGAPMVGACMVANTKGAVVGNKSTPIELGRVEDALDLI
ncbi:MAG: translation initiation factor IF-6 [Methanomassiliicoccales archaeon]|nr:translation initiation factor IF-6 [Methanomassiliicoccales archaeon]